MDREMNNKMSGRQKIVLFFVIFALLTGMYFGIVQWKDYLEDKMMAQAEAKATMVVQMESLQDLSFYNGTDVISFSRNTEGLWIYQEDKEFSVDQSSLVEFENLLRGLPAKEAFEDPDALSVYGLSPAAYYISATDKEGQSVILSIGNETNGNYFAYVEGAATVYTVGPEAVGLCKQKLYDFVQYEKFPRIYGDDIQSITAKTDDGTISLLKSVEMVDESSEQIEWMISEGDSNKVITNKATIDRILNHTTAITFDRCINYKADKEERKHYQLHNGEKKLTVVYQKDGKENTVELNFGSVIDENGDYYYVSMNGSRQIVLVESSTIDTIFEEICQLTVSE